MKVQDLVGKENLRRRNSERYKELMKAMEYNKCKM